MWFEYRGMRLSTTCHSVDICRSPWVCRFCKNKQPMVTQQPESSGYRDLTAYNIASRPWPAHCATQGHLLWVPKLARLGPIDQSECDLTQRPLSCQDNLISQSEITLPTVVFNQQSEGTALSARAQMSRKEGTGSGEDHASFSLDMVLKSSCGG